MEDPQEDPCRCTAFVCVAVVLLEDTTWVSRSVEREVLSILSIYLRIFCMHSLCIVSYWGYFFVFVFFMRISVGLVVTTCQAIVTRLL